MGARQDRLGRREACVTMKLKCSEFPGETKLPRPPSYNGMGLRAVPHKNERVELEMKIMKYRQLARLTSSDEETRRRIEGLVAELQQKLREIDE